MTVESRASQQNEQPCLLGQTDYEKCMVPFRYCPEKGCGRTQTPDPLAEAGAAAIDLARVWERFWGAVRALEASNRSKP